MDDFLLRALVAGLGLAVMTGPVGCVLVWRRLAFFGDTLAHAAMLGVALGLLLGINVIAGVAATSILLALVIAASQRQALVPSDTVLAILSQGGLATGVILLYAIPGGQGDLLAYLIGDILSVGPEDLYLIVGAAVITLGLLAVIWRPILAVAVDGDLAQTGGIRTGLINLAVVVLAAIVVAVGVRVVGVVLLAALLIMPAAAARRWARTPEQMAGLAALVGVLAVILGLGGSLEWDSPAGPSIVAAAVLLVVLAWAIPRRQRAS